MKEQNESILFIAEGKREERHNINIGLNISGAERLLESEFYMTGEIAKVKATPRQGMVFVNWTKENKVISEQPEYEFEVESDCYLVANFVRELPGRADYTLPLRKSDLDKAV